MLGKRADDIDNVMDSLNEWEERRRKSEAPEHAQGKILIGTVAQYFEKIGVAAIRLTADLNVGDVIEIGNEEEAIRQRVDSMQIDRKDVGSASEGDDVGVKLKYHVGTGSEVYRITR